MTTEESKKAHSLISHFQKRYKEKYNTSCIVNRNKLQYLLANMLKDLTATEIKKLIDFYVETDKSPTLLYFCYEYDEVHKEMQLQNDDRAVRQQLLSETQKSVLEYRKRYGKNAE